jgi:hypothetical protein
VQAPGLSLRFGAPLLAERLFDFLPEAPKLFKSLREIVSCLEEHRFAIVHINPLKTFWRCAEKVNAATAV